MKVKITMIMIITLIKKRNNVIIDNVDNVDNVDHH